MATYGRSLYALALGLFCGRWSLMVLGEVDYGLLGLIGGLSGMISMLSWIVAAAVGRYYGVSIGAARVSDDSEEALDVCRHWFNTAFLVHISLAVILVAIGYPVGAWAIRNFLTIPTERLDECIIIFRFVCLSCFFGMANIPFVAMYQAKQYIAELTIYSFVTQTINVGAIYYMLNHPGDWLLVVSALGCAIGVVPPVIIAIRACWLFPECKFKLNYMYDWGYLKQIVCLSGWQLVDTVNTILRDHGKPIVVNKFFGAAMNAAMTIGNTVQSHCNTLASSMHGAFAPAITQAYGAGEFDRMRALVVRSSKFNVLMTLIFVIPLALELPEVMRLWLKTPPRYAVELCWFAMLIHLLGCCVASHHIAIYATARIASYNVLNCIVSALAIGCAVLVGFAFRHVYAVMGVFAFFMGVTSLVRLVYARRLVAIRIRTWFWDVCVKTALISLITAAVGFVPRLFMRASFYRVVATTLCCEMFFIPLLWFALSPVERQYVSNKFLSRVIAGFRKFNLRGERGRF